MDGNHPNRKKDKFNPYVLTQEQGRSFISFTDGEGHSQKTEVDEAVYAAFDRFELDDISHMNEVSRHLEQSELTEETLQGRAVTLPEPVEEQILRKMLYEQLHTAIDRLSEIQRRRLILYYFEGYTYEEIAQMEGCKHPAIMKSVAAAERNIKKYFSE